MRYSVSWILRRIKSGLRKLSISNNESVPDELKSTKLIIALRQKAIESLLQQRLITRKENYFIYCTLHDFHWRNLDFLTAPRRRESYPLGVTHLNPALVCFNYQSLYCESRVLLLILSSWPSLRVSIFGRVTELEAGVYRFFYGFNRWPNHFFVWSTF